MRPVRIWTGAHIRSWIGHETKREVTMKGAVLAALIATTALLPAPLAAQPAAPAQQASGRRGPANICQELIAFLEPPAPPAAPGAAPATPAPAQAQAQA